MSAPSKGRDRRWYGLPLWVGWAVMGTGFGAIFFGMFVTVFMPGWRP